MSLAYQPIKLNWLIKQIDHPPDQIPASVGTIGCGNGFSRQTKGIRVLGLTVGSENNLLIQGSVDGEVSPFTGRGSYGRPADPLKLNPYRLVSRADDTRRAEDTDLEFCYRGRAAFRQDR